MYCFYRVEYGGTEIPEKEFGAVMQRARHWLKRCYRVYTVAECDEMQRKMALCAVAEGIYQFLRLQNGDVGEKMSIGSVSYTVAVPQIPKSEAQQERELLRRAGMYLDICRSAGGGYA